nr:MAG TPA: hypothetical protein [Caudoviricetes sp.]DAS82091.1 MAG TPA: hypothetical protein [Caudoviricetes sp.]
MTTNFTRSCTVILNLFRCKRLKVYILFCRYYKLVYICSIFPKRKMGANIRKEIN